MTDSNFRTKNSFVEKPQEIESRDRIVSMMMNEKYDIFVVLWTGRVFRARARGHSGSYDAWQEVDLLQEIRDDISKQV